jgi:hypothetical protein
MPQPGLLRDDQEDFTAKDAKGRNATTKSF